MPGALQRDPFIDQGACIGARDARFRGAQMAQPAEAKQRCRPFVGWRLHFENRAAVADHDLAGEGEAAGVDFTRPRRVGSAQIVRRDQEPVGLERYELPAHQRMTVGAAGNPPHGTAQQEPRQLRVVRNCNARHYALAPLCVRAQNCRPPDHNETMTERPIAE